MTVLETSPRPTDAVDIRGAVVGHERRRRRPVRYVLAAALALSLTAELTARVFEDHLPPDEGWISDEYPMKREQMAALAADGGAGVVLLGSSVVDTAVDPALLSAEATGGRGAYNAGLVASTPVIDAAWGLGLVVPELRPDTVVVALSSRDLNGNGAGMRTQDARFAASPGGQWVARTQSLADEVEWWLQEHSALLQHRQALRRPLESVFGYDPPDRNATELTDRGYEPQLADVPYRDGASVEAFFRGQPLRDFAITDDQLDAVRRLVSTLEDEGVRVVLLDVPVTERYVSLHPHGAADMAAYEAIVDELAADAGAEVFRPGTWPTEYFSDPLHVNGAGAERLTRELDRYLTAGR